MDNFEAKYKVLLHDLALEITHDESRAMNLARSVFQEINGELEEDGRRRSLFQDFDGRVSLLDWLRALLKQRDAGELNATVPKLHRALRTPLSQPTATWCNCLSCQTQLVTGRANNRYSGELKSAVSWLTRSTVLPLRVMGIAGVVGILAWAVWLSGQPQQFVGRGLTILRAVIGQARDVTQTRSETRGDPVSLGVGTASRASEARKYPITVELSTVESSQSTSGDKTHATLAPVTPHSQSPDSGLDTKVVADYSESQDFSLRKGSGVTARDQHGVRDMPVPGIRNAKPSKRRTLYHVKSARLYTMEQAKPVIQRLRSLGYTADATPVESGDETMYEIQVGTYKTADEADDAADDLDSRYNAIYNSPRVE